MKAKTVDLGGRGVMAACLRDAKLVSYHVVEKSGKPAVEVLVKGQKKVGGDLQGGTPGLVPGERWWWLRQWGAVQVFTPEEISAMVLTKMKQTAEVGREASMWQ